MKRMFVLAVLPLLALGAKPGRVVDSDAYMGDYAGTRTAEGGQPQPLAAQVLAQGKGEYLVNVLPAFDQRVPALVVMTGKEQDGQVVLKGEAGGTTWQGAIKDKTFTGTYAGASQGAFELKHTVRLSPTLGAKPPEGAVVLFDGTSTDEWEQVVGQNYIVDLKRALGNAENCAGYLMVHLWAPRKQRVRLEMGSDDGLKAFLDGEVIHEANALRGCQPGSDKAFPTLNEGWNTLLLKVTQGGGDWAACARVVDLFGQPVKGLRVATEATDAAAKGPEQGGGWFLDFNVAGPYAKDGLGPEQLFNEPFPPEQDAKVAYDAYTLRGPVDRTCRWKLVDGGAMQVYAGSAVTKKAFGDHRLHLEFRTPLMPESRGQSRGNSGVYIQTRYELQVLDSYGLEGLDNECGGIYKNARPLVNMCAPPLQWQTYDVTFHAAQVDEAGNVTQKGCITVLHNGVPIHKDLEIEPTPGGITYDMSKPGGILLQDHGNPVQYRNIWVLPL